MLHRPHDSSTRQSQYSKDGEEPAISNREDQRRGHNAADRREYVPYQIVELGTEM